jgi:glycerol uptake facilitator-like aquaporin
MKRPPLNVLVGFIFAAVATFQPIVYVDPSKVTLPTTPSWGLLIWAGVAVLLGLYGRKRREYIGPALLLALNPIFTKVVLENVILPEARLSNVPVAFSVGAFLAWIASVFIFSAVFSKDSDVTSDKFNNMNTENPPPNPTETNTNINKNTGINKTAVFITLILCASILAAVFMFRGQKVEVTRNVEPKQSVVTSPEIPESKKAAEQSKVTIIDKGLALSGLQNAEGGKASADYYNKYMTEQVSCQMIAGSIRNTVERIDISPVKIDGLYGYHREYPSPNTAGVKKALELAANFYRKSVRNKLLLSSAGIDPDVVAYVEKFAVFDQRTSDLYGEYAETLQSRTKQIEEIGKARDEQVARDESVLIKNFESKFGIKLQTRQELRKSAMKSTSAEARRFLDTKSPQELAANLIGYSFDNINGYDKWRVDAGEYVFGRIMDSACNPGVAIVDLEVQLRGSSSGQPGLIRSRIIYVKDPDRNLFWAAAVQDLGRR